MSQLIQRPDYIEYNHQGLDRGWFTQADIDTLEDEPAIFQWTIPHAFDNKYSAWKIHVPFVSVLGIPLLWSTIYVIYGIINYGGLIPGYMYELYVLFFVFTFFAYGFFYWISRSAYHHIVFKVTESGILRDQLKLMPKHRYRRQDPTKFVHFLRWLSVPFILMALMIHPLLLAGAAGAIFISFMPIRIDDAERAHYIPVLWNDSSLPKEEQISTVNIVPKRRIIHITSDNGANGATIFCTSENFEQIKEFVLKKLPHAKREHLLSYV
ncbi:hypothetical protein [Psychromonas arctica]|uniref:hypothetical protein n=1 Tax=Psychromonas arctica TaxID=168275 RepID=UPI002FD04DCA